MYIAMYKAINIKSQIIIISLRILILILTKGHLWVAKNKLVSILIIR